MYDLDTCMGYSLLSSHIVWDSHHSVDGISYKGCSGWMPPSVNVPTKGSTPDLEASRSWKSLFQLCPGSLQLSMLSYFCAFCSTIITSLAWTWDYRLWIWLRDVSRRPHSICPCPLRGMLGIQAVLQHCTGMPYCSTMLSPHYSDNRRYYHECFQQDARTAIQMTP